MTDPGESRRFNEEEVALIIKRAAELQQTEDVADEPANALSLTEVEQIAKEAGIDPGLIRRAAQSLDRPEAVNRPSPWAGAPTRLAFERVVDGEISPEDYEQLVDVIRRTIGDNGIPSVLGKTLSWTTRSDAPRRGHSRHVDVNIVARRGVTTIRVDEELRNLAGPIFGGLVGGGGFGTTGITVGIGMGQLHSAPLAAAMWIGAAGGFYLLARTIFGYQARKREAQLRDLVGRLEEQVTTAIEERKRQIGAGAARSLGAGSDPAVTG